MDETDLESAYPDIAWREPLPIKTEEATGLGCRYCIAMHGVQGRDVSKLAQNRADFDWHLYNFHPRSRRVT